ncbi:ribosome silencing factor [Chrysiogenes arsenatis]|uniref:ribosome silencing factor n=1 Tax=Chrysiogenes arsenatis TaxID=309797 RepID=UPI0004107E68|nr:ribosome silencing factor [Chrysiogenes arsenatis]
MEPIDLLHHIHRLADEKHAENVQAFALAGISSFADYFYICTAGSERQAIAIADHIQEELKKQFREIALGVEGKGNSQWILLDYGSVLVHIFLPELRDFYRLEALWAEAPEVKFEVSSPELR